MNFLEKIQGCRRRKNKQQINELRRKFKKLKVQPGYANKPTDAEGSAEVGDLIELLLLFNYLNYRQLSQRLSPSRGLCIFLEKFEFFTAVWRWRVSQYRIVPAFEGRSGFAVPEKDRDAIPAAFSLWRTTCLSDTRRRSRCRLVIRPLHLPAAHPPRR
jgi:hypothetical protein